MRATWIGIAFMVGMITMFIILQRCDKKEPVYIEKKGVPIVKQKINPVAHFEKAVKPKPKKTFKVAKKVTPNVEVVNSDTLASIPDSAIINVYNDTTQIGRAKIIQRDSVQGTILKRQLGCIGCFDTTFVYVTDTLIVDKKCPKTPIKDLGLAFGAGYLMGILTVLFVK
jgi:hypothetical protein